MKNQTSKILLNGVLLAAMAAVGLTSYQLITSPVKEEMIPDEVQVEMEKESEVTESPLLVDAGTTHVVAEVDEVEDSLPEDELVLEMPEENEKESEENEDMQEKELQESVALNEWEPAEEEETAETSSLPASAAIPAAAYLKFSENTLMEWPVHGNILLDYDMDETTYFPTLDQYRLNPAISVQAVEGAPVVASVDGVVHRITDDPRTGTTVTMELGNGYQAIYGQLKDLSVGEGETVGRGTTIGYIDTPTKYYSEEGCNLYFAMKKDGEPIDPILYLP